MAYQYRLFYLTKLSIRNILMTRFRGVALSTPSQPSVPFSHNTAASIPQSCAIARHSIAGTGQAEPRWKVVLAANGSQHATPSGMVNRLKIPSINDQS